MLPIIRLATVLVEVAVSTTTSGLVLIFAVTFLSTVEEGDTVFLPVARGISTATSERTMVPRIEVLFIVIEVTGWTTGTSTTKASLVLSVLILLATTLLLDGANWDHLHLRNGGVSGRQVLFSSHRCWLVEHIFTRMGSQLLSILKLLNLFELVLESEVSSLEILDVLVL